jgi:hypothetical protein
VRILRDFGATFVQARFQYPRGYGARAIFHPAIFWDSAILNRAILLIA